MFPGLGLPASDARRDQHDGRTRCLASARVLLLLGCANVANLLVFRAARREHEMAVRKALGASRSRLLQLQLMESWMLACGGAAIGLALAVYLKQVIEQLMFPRGPGAPLRCRSTCECSPRRSLVALAQWNTRGARPRMAGDADTRAGGARARNSHREPCAEAARRARGIPAVAVADAADRRAAARLHAAQPACGGSRLRSCAGHGRRLQPRRTRLRRRSRAGLPP